EAALDLAQQQRRGLLPPSNRPPPPSARPLQIRATAAYTLSASRTSCDPREIVAARRVSYISSPDAPDLFEKSRLVSIKIVPHRFGLGLWRRRWRAAWCGCVGWGIALALSGRAMSVEQPNLPPGDYTVSSNDFGGVGLLQMRTARMQPDGQFDFGASVVDP